MTSILHRLWRWREQTSWQSPVVVSRSLMYRWNTSKVSTDDCVREIAWSKLAHLIHCVLIINLINRILKLMFGILRVSQYLPSRELRLKFALFVTRWDPSRWHRRLLDSIQSSRLVWLIWLLRASPIIERHPALSKILSLSACFRWPQRCMSILKISFGCGLILSVIRCWRLSEFGERERLRVPQVLNRILILAECTLCQIVWCVVALLLSTRSFVILWCERQPISTSRRKSTFLSCNSVLAVVYPSNWELSFPLSLLVVFRAIRLLIELHLARSVYFSVVGVHSLIFEIQLNFILSDSDSLY